MERTFELLKGISDTCARAPSIQSWYVLLSLGSHTKNLFVPVYAQEFRSSDRITSATVSHLRNFRHITYNLVFNIAQNALPWSSSTIIHSYWGVSASGGVPEDAPGFLRAPEMPVALYNRCLSFQEYSLYYISNKVVFICLVELNEIIQIMMHVYLKRFYCLQTAL